MIIESVMCLLTELSILKKDKQIEERIEQEKAGAAERTRASLLNLTLIGQDLLLEGSTTKVEDKQFPGM